MTYAQYLRKVRKEAMRREWPWLCSCNNYVCQRNVGTALYRARLADVIDATIASVPDVTFLPTALRQTRPSWAARLKNDGKRIRISWLTERIKAADAEAALAAK